MNGMIDDTIHKRLEAHIDDRLEAIRQAQDAPTMRPAQLAGGRRYVDALYWNNHGSRACAKHAPGKGTDTWEWEGWRKVKPHELAELAVPVGDGLTPAELAESGLMVSDACGLDCCEVCGAQVKS